VWSSIFEPISTFGSLARLARESESAVRHDRPYQVVGSDASGVVLRVGAGVRNWKPGDRVTVHCNHVDDQDQSAHNDSMMAANQRIWGYETNFGGLADLAVVKANQLMPKPAHLTWEEAAVNALCNSTSYRMLVGRNGAQMKQGDVVLIWGATGGIGAYATQYVLNGGGIPVCVVSSPDKADILRKMGVEHIIDRASANYQFWKDEHTQDESEWRRLGKDIRDLCGEDPDIVFEHPGRSTFGASMYVAKRGGTVVTCAATSGFQLEFDNRHFWMRLKKLVGSHFANYKEAWEANRLISKGMVHPVMSQVFTLEQTGEAAYQVHHNMHEGKIAVLALAPSEGLGVTDEVLRAKVADQLTWFRR
jgi:crotonyl-CoA reductase